MESKAQLEPFGVTAHVEDGFSARSLLELAEQAGLQNGVALERVRVLIGRVASQEAMRQVGSVVGIDTIETEHKVIAT